MSQHLGCPPASNTQQGYFITSAKNETSLVQDFVSDLFTGWTVIHLWRSKETENR